jgi:hypothetical protein
MRPDLTRGVPNLGGPEGNARLTTTTGVLLLVLLALEGVTILFIRPLISMHVFVGLMLIPPIALKLASTGWRFLRYYTGSRPYVLQGPPHPYMRVVVAPLVVVSTLVLFGTGVAMLAVRPQGGNLVGLHKGAFIVWLAATGIHVLFHLPRLARLARAELRPSTRVSSAWLRVVLVGAALTAGALFAAAAFHLATPWLDWVRVR